MRPDRLPARISDFTRQVAADLVLEKYHKIDEHLLQCSRFLHELKFEHRILRFEIEENAREAVHAATDESLDLRLKAKILAKTSLYLSGLEQVDAQKIRAAAKLAKERGLELEYVEPLPYTY